MGAWQTRNIFCMAAWVLWCRGLTKWYSIKNRTKSLAESARSCSLQFLEPGSPLHHWIKHFRGRLGAHSCMSSFHQAVSELCPFSLWGSAWSWCTLQQAVWSHRAVTPLGCLKPVNKEIPVFKTLSLALSALLRAWDMSECPDMLQVIQPLVHSFSLSAPES